MTALSEPVQRAGSTARLRLRQGMAKATGLLAWWKHSLLAWLPKPWRAWLGWASERLLLLPEDGRVRVYRQVEDQLEALPELTLPMQDGEASASLDTRSVRLPRWLVVPASGVLRRQWRLPAAAEARLHDVVGFEIDRQTPFQAADVYFDARVLGRHGEQIEVELVVVPRKTVERLQAVLGNFGAVLAGIAVVDAGQQVWPVNLLPAGQRQRHHDGSRHWDLVLAAIGLIALVLAGRQVLENRRVAAMELQARVEALVVEARQVAARRQQLQALVEGREFLAKARAQRPAMIEVLDEVSRRLPDSTYLERLGLEGNQLMLSGYSHEASALVALMEAATLWRSPALNGPLQPDVRIQRDRFSLGAELVGPGANIQGGADDQVAP